MEAYIFKKLPCHTLYLSRYYHYISACRPSICKLPLLKVNPLRKNYFYLRFLHGKTAEKSKDDNLLKEQQEEISTVNSEINEVSNLKFDEKKLKENLVIYNASTGIIFVPDQTNPKILSQRSPAKCKDMEMWGKHIASSIKSSKKQEIRSEEQMKQNLTSTNFITEGIKYTTFQWTPQKIDVKNLPNYYASLAKSRLTGLVVLTAVAGYIIAPAPFDPGTFCLCSAGTALVSSSANAINQAMEVPFDSQMLRTKNRVLVRGCLTPLHAVLFGLSCGCSGIGIFYFGVNEVTTAFGFLNLFLYTCLYTPMKRISIANTWIGSIVGAIPPVIGWTGCTGSFDAGALILGGILFAWQFPHFNALSWNLRQDYSKAGYRMMSVIRPDLCRRTALSYCAVILLLSTMAPVLNVTTWTFAADSLPLNLYFTYLAWKFYKDADSKTSRKLFHFSLLHLPLLLALMIISRKTVSKVEDTKKSL